MPFRDPSLALEQKLRSELNARRELDLAIRVTRGELDRWRGARRAARLDRLGRLFVGVLMFLFGLTALCAVGLALIVALSPRCTGSRIDRTRTDAQSVRSASVMFVSENPGKPCPAMRDLTDGGFLDSSRRTVDEWDQPFTIVCTGDDVRVISAGPDEVFGTDDDIE